MDDTRTLAEPVFRVPRGKQFRGMWHDGFILGVEQSNPAPALRGFNPFTK